MEFDQNLKCSAGLITKGKAEKMNFSASQKVCKELAERFGYLEVKSLEGQVEIRQLSSACWLLKGQITAEIIQACVVSGEAVPESLNFEMHERYLETLEDAEEIDPMGVDVELLIKGDIPVGEAISQALAVHANAWPRDEKAPILGPPDKLRDENHPFAKLSELKNLN